ncbi:nudix hydrolase 9 [Ziziphus jujuba]|uniref:Nudix hydrolase 9 n=1 Tax=Ziziphus jujuba TaxID=326968 RepID=A0A6P3ZKY9_ZIZJJ|nr:nudix hydrolase 9 [Ziziphus jujuba]
MEKAETGGTTKPFNEPSPHFKLLLSCPSGLSPSQVSVVFDETYDRVPHPDMSLENSISEIWDQRIQRSTSLYNGQKFRYGGHMLCNGDGCDKESRVCLHLGLTDYRTFVGTNLNPLWEKFLVISKDDSIRCQHTSSPLGNGAIVETSDKKILVLKRSNDVGEFPGHFVFPGGHPEPQEVGISFHQHEIDSEAINKKVSLEMFDSIIREVVEEIGVPAASLCEPVFIGISRRELNVRPAAFFSIKCSLDSMEIQQMYSSAQDGFESTELYMVSVSDLESMGSRMPGCHQGGLALYMLMVEAEKNV